ncbi:MAG: LicD family protein [Lachnospiraceae bacterium]|nr:LicD family protein [Lachnospiraceae bacterium]
MDFPYDYFQDEVKEGFYVSGLIKRAWAAQLEVLNEIDKVCKLHNIKWYIDSGILLGAIRHGGFIPWDDDVDICMSREDYDKFIQIAENEMPKGYILLNYDKDDYDNLWLRVTNEDKIVFNRSFLDKYHDCPYAMGIDIFPLDYMASDEETERKRGELVSLLCSVTDVISEENKCTEEIKNILSEIEDLCDVRFDYEMDIKKQLYMATEKIFSLFDKKDASYVIHVLCWYQSSRSRYKIEDYSNSMLYPFETTMLPAPINYHDVLSCTYGNYMETKKGGAMHDYPFFLKQMDKFEQELGNNSYNYVFDVQDLNRNEELKKNDVKSSVHDFLGILDKAYSIILRLLNTEEYPECFAILESCQTSAINIGEMIEAVYGEEHVSVRVLEEYCESIYEIYEALSEALITKEAASEALKCITQKVKKEITSTLLERREVAFLPFRAKYWDAMKSIWECASMDDTYDTYVIPIPYYEKTALGELGNFYYEGNEFPDDMVITGYEDYDFEKRHPDIIFIQVPYDEYNYTLSVEPFYYSKNLKKYTDKLIYVPFFELNDNYGQNSCEKKTMEFFCRVPGLVHADKIFVQSEEMREAYVNCLSEFAGEDTKDIWEQKISGIGTPLSDVKILNYVKERNDILKNLPADWRNKLFRKDGTIKKIILCVTSVTSFINFGEQAIKDLETTFDFIQTKAEEVCLLWMTYPITPTDAEGKPLPVPAIQKLLDKYEKEAWMLYDKMADIGRGCVLCDGYYGDPCWGGHRCEILGKPVRYINCITETKGISALKSIQDFCDDVLKFNGQDTNDIETGVGKKIWDEACKN